MWLNFPNIWKAYGLLNIFYFYLDSTAAWDRILYELSPFKCTETFYIPIYCHVGEYSTCTWKEFVFGTCWLKYLINVSQVKMLITLLKSSMSYLIYGLIVLSSAKKELLKFPNCDCGFICLYSINILYSIKILYSINICFIILRSAFRCTQLGFLCPID